MVKLAMGRVQGGPSVLISCLQESALSEENYWFRWRSVDCKCSDAQPLSLSLASLGWDYSEALIFPLHHVAILCVISEF